MMRGSEKIFIFKIFTANLTFGFFLKISGSVYVPKDHIR